MTIELGPLRPKDAAAHCAGEDELTVRWLTGGYGDVAGTVEYFRWLADNAAAGVGKRGLGVWLSGRLCGYVDYDPGVSDGLEAGDVNVTYAVHPWARGQGVATGAVRQLLDLLRTERVGTRAAILVEPENIASVRVAQRADFTFVRGFVSTTDFDADGTPRTLSLYVHDLSYGDES